jgi:ATP-dependent Clp protease ATP-binding subunit ClpA
VAGSSADRPRRDLRPATTRWLGDKGYDDAFGAWPLARVIQDHIKKLLADKILFGKLQNGGTVRALLDRETDKLVFEFITDEKPKQLSPPEKSEENV